MRLLLPLMAVAGLVACSPPVPDSGAGVGFENYDRYLADRQARDRALANSPAQQPARQAVLPPARTAPAQTAQAAPAAVPPRSAAEQTAAEAVAAIRQSPAPGTQVARAPVQTAPQTNNAGISDEQDFQAVSSRQSIESDAQRRAQQSAQYEVVQPTAVPRRPGSTTPTPIEFAVQVSHPRGQKVYRRSPFGAGKVAENCRAYASADLAQDAFLKAGGPDRDKLKLDPDGDGYACAWDPAKYRRLVRG